VENGSKIYKFWIYRDKNSKFFIKKLDFSMKKGSEKKKTDKYGLY